MHCTDCPLTVVNNESRRLIQTPVMLFPQLPYRSVAPCSLPSSCGVWSPWAWLSWESSSLWEPWTRCWSSWSPTDKSTVSQARKLALDAFHHLKVWIELGVTSVFNSCFCLVCKELEHEAEQKGKNLHLSGLLKMHLFVTEWDKCPVYLTCSEFLLGHLRHAAALVSGHLPSDWLHHGLEDEGVWGGSKYSRCRKRVRI